MLNSFDTHPALRNSQIFAVWKQQSHSDLEDYSDYIQRLTEIYNQNKVAFQSLANSFDNICYNVIIPICKHHSSHLFQYLKEQNSIINKVGFLNHVTENILDLLYNLSYKTLWQEYKEFVLALPDENDELTEDEVNQLFVLRFKNLDQVHSFFSKYPVLAKILCESTETSLNKYKQIYQFLSQDISSVCSYFDLKIETNKLIEIQSLTISGDNHNKNNFVAIIEFAENQKIVLKNRTAKPEILLNKTIEFLVDKNINLKGLKILEMDEHYWTDFIEYKPCSEEKEIADYYTQIGNLTALLYVLNAVDIHYENIIANGAYPIIVDAECLFYANFDSGYCNNVLDISLLPSDHQIGERVVWLGGVDKTDEQNALFSNLIVDENYQLIEEKGNFKNARNIPFLQSGGIINIFDYQENIEYGFCEVYALLIQYRNEFKSLIQSQFPLEVRYLNRSTYTYSHLVRQSLFPKYLINSSAYSWVFEWLWYSAEINSKYNELIPYEQKMLKQRFIPLFCYNTNSTNLLTFNGEIAHKDFFIHTAKDLFLRKISTLSEEDKKIQLQIIQMQFLKLTNNNTQYFSSENFLKQVIKKMEDSIMPVNGSIETFDFIGGNVKKVDINLYDGYAGYLLFLIYYRKIHQDDSVNNLISLIYKKIIFEIEQQEKNFEIGAFLGVSGCLYVFTHLFALEQDATYLKDIERIEFLILESVNQNLVSSNDILGGIAGSIVCLYSFYKLCNKENTKKLIIQLAEILIENAEQIDENTVGWISKRGVPLVGYSHGNSGIGQALLIAYEVSKNNIFLTCFERCLNFEEKKFDKEKEVWSDERNELYEHENTSWCNGATGIGLSRINYSKYNRKSICYQDIKRALEISLRLGITDIDVLCHGNWGTIELLLYYCQNIENERNTIEYLDKIKLYLLERIDKNIIKCNNKNNLLSISFMTGITGIAYQILRLENPDKVPSVLVLDIPFKKY